MNDFGNIKMKFRNEFWLILFREYIIPNLFAVQIRNSYCEETSADIVKRPGREGVSGINR
jgi:hypothetical protein